MSTGEHLVEEISGQRQEGFDFLAPERQQKFDLLIHLLSNLDRPIFLAGPFGIGKSTMLRQLHARALPGGQICLIEASGELSFEGLLHHLAMSLGVDAGSVTQLREKLDSMSERDETVVLALDDAGRLMPGVLDALCRFAFHCPALRIVAALRPDDIHVKGMTDPWAVEEAHIIELPPLNAMQAQSYLQTIWNRMGKTLEPEGKEFEGVYGATHGIPENVRRYAHERMGKPSIQWHQALAKPVYLGLGLVILAVMGVTWWQMQQAPEAKNKTSGPTESRTKHLLYPEARNAESEDARDAIPPRQEETGGTALPENNAELPSLEIRSAVSLDRERSEDPADDTKTAEMTEVSPDIGIASGFSKSVEPVTIPVKTQEMQQEADVTAENVPSKPVPAPPPPSDEQGLQSAAWLMNQPPLHFTLQIAAFDKLEDLKAFAAHHEQLEPLAYYHKRHQGRDWYPLLYGIYPSLDAAKKAQESLPPAIRQRKPWLRRLRSVQKDIARDRSEQAG